MPRYSSRVRSYSPSTSGVTSELGIVWSSSGGHTHDGVESSLINGESYSLFDFRPTNRVSTIDRSNIQERNRESLKSFIVNTIKEDYIEFNNITIGPDVIGAQNIIAGSINSDLIAANTIVANNIAANTITTELLDTDAIQSLNYDAPDGAEIYSDAGSFLDLSNGEFITPGLRLYSNGDLYISNSVVIGGTTANTVVDGAASGASSLQPGEAAGDVNSGTTTINGGKIRTGDIQSTDFSWNGSSVYSSDGTRFDLDNGQIIGQAFRLYSNGNMSMAGTITANAGSIGGWTINSSNITSNATTIYSTGHIYLNSGATRIYSNGYLYLNNGTTRIYSNGYIRGNSGRFTVNTSGYLTATGATITGTINATSGSFSGNLTSSATITGGEFAGGTFSLSAGSSTRIRFGASYGQGVDIDGGTVGSINVGVWPAVGFEGNIYQVVQSGSYPGAAHRFYGRMSVASDVNYSTSWDRQQIVAYSSTGNAGMAIRAGTDTGTVQFRVGYNFGVLYIRNHNDSAYRTVNCGTVNADGNLTATGTKPFEIPHPILDGMRLRHTAVEAPLADLIYRGVAKLKNGRAEVNIDEFARMTDGTFVALCRNVSCFTSNESDWGSVRGFVNGNILTIEAEDAKSQSTVSWLVVGERNDDKIKESDATDDDGRLITEFDRPDHEID